MLLHLLIPQANKYHFQERTLPAADWSAAEMRHIDGIADGSLAPALAVKTEAVLSAATTASGPVDPLEPKHSNSA